MDDIEYMEYESEEEYSGGSAGGSPSASSSEDEDWETKDPADWTKLDVNNAYHISKDREDEEGLETAIAGFEKVLVMEQKVFGKHKKWSFKALKRLIRLESSVGNEEKSIRYFKDLLTYNKNDNGITEAELLKGISSVLDAVSAGTSVGFALHEIALSALRALKNETLWFKTSLRFAQKLFDLGNHTAVQKVLKEARATCLLEDGSDNPRKGGQLLEIYGIRIQALMLLNKTKKVAAMYGKADRLAAANPGTLDNRMAIFHFVGAQLKLEAQQWEKAYAAFFEALSHLQEGSSNQRIPCMRYFLLSSMLGQSQVKQTIDPFASPEIRHMKNLPGVAPMADLVAAFQRHDLQDFERVLNKNRSALMEDPIVAKYLPLVHREMRCHVLTESVKAYSCIGLPFVATKLGVRMDELYDLLVFLIQEGRIKGQLDCVKQQLILDTSATGGARHSVPYQALDKWVNQLGALHTTILGRVA